MIPLGIMTAFIKFKGWVKLIPRAVWIGLAVVILCVVLFKMHQKIASDRIQASYEAGVKASDERWLSDLAAMRTEGVELREQYETNVEQAVLAERKRNETELRSVNQLATNLRLRGPGAASACTGSNSGSGLSSSSGGLTPINGEANAPLDTLPADEPMATVPWNELVNRAEQCDINLTELNTWRRWYPTQKLLVEQYKTSLESAN